MGLFVESLGRMGLASARLYSVETSGLVLRVLQSPSAT